MYKILIFLTFIFFTIYACEVKQRQKNKENTKTSMKQSENNDIAKIIASLKTGMIEYIEPGETEYTVKDVEKCISLINAFLIDMRNSDSKENGMKLVEQVVLKLNQLNDQCEGELIETEQREQLTEIIILAGHLKGFLIITF